MVFGTEGSEGIYQEQLGCALREAEMTRIPALPAACGCPQHTRDATTVAFVGSLEERKGFPGLVAAWPYVLQLEPAARLTVIGKGPLEMAARELEHTGEQAGGPTALVQGSAGFVPHALDGHRADLAYLGVGQLGLRPEQYIRDFWHHTVRAVGARRVTLTHWDDFFRPLDQPLRALPYAGDDLDLTLRILRAEARNDGVRLTMPSVWRAESPWSTR